MKHEINQTLDQLSQLVDTVGSSRSSLGPGVLSEIQTQFNAGKAQVNVLIRDLLSKDDSLVNNETIEQWDQELLSLDVEFYKLLNQNFPSKLG